MCAGIGLHFTAFLTALHDQSSLQRGHLKGLGFAFNHCQSSGPAMDANRTHKRITRIGAAIAVLATFGVIGAGNAEPQMESALVASSVQQDAGPRFTPSAEAQFAEAFAPFDTPAAPTLPDNAVDITTIEPAEPETTVLGSRMASYYGRRFHGRLTANGERFDMNAMTAAHKTLPFGTRLRVTYPRTGRSVVVRINDRGPFIRGRDIDLSRGAAERIGLIQQGHGRVEVELLDS